MASSCGHCPRLMAELRILKQQLTNSHAELQAMEHRFHAATSENARHHQRGPENTTMVGESSPIPAPVTLAEERMRGFGRVSEQFPFRYVPPADFLPETFVRQFGAELLIIDRYAHLFHRHHVGARGGLRFVDGRAVSHAELDATAFDSQRRLFEARIGALEAENESLKRRVAILEQRSAGVVSAGDARGEGEGHDRYRQPSSIGQRRFSDGAEHLKRRQSSGGGSEADDVSSSGDGSTVQRLAEAAAARRAALAARRAVTAASSAPGVTATKHDERQTEERRVEIPAAVPRASAFASSSFSEEPSSSKVRQQGAPSFRQTAVAAVNNSSSVSAPPPRAIVPPSFGVQPMGGAQPPRMFGGGLVRSTDMPAGGAAASSSWRAALANDEFTSGDPA